MGDPIPQGKWAIFGGKRELCKNGWTDWHAILDEVLGGTKEPCIRWGADLPMGRGKGVIWAFQKHRQFAAIFSAKGTIQSPITSCSRRDHSVCQANANRNLENSEHRWCGLSAGMGWWECTAWVKSDINYCLVVTVAWWLRPKLRLCFRKRSSSFITECVQAFLQGMLNAVRHFVTALFLECIKMYAVSVCDFCLSRHCWWRVL